MSMLIMLQLPQGDNATGILDVLKLMQDRRGSNTQINAIEFPDFTLWLFSESNFKKRQFLILIPKIPGICGNFKKVEKKK